VSRARPGVSPSDRCRVDVTSLTPSTYIHTLYHARRLCRRRRRRRRRPQILRIIFRARALFDRVGLGRTASTCALTAVRIIFSPQRASSYRKYTLPAWTAIYYMIHCYAELYDTLYIDSYIFSLPDSAFAAFLRGSCALIIIIIIIIIILTPECTRLRLELLVRLVTENYRIMATKSNSKHRMLPSGGLTHLLLIVRGVLLNISGNPFCIKRCDAVDLHISDTNRNRRTQLTVVLMHFDTCSGLNAILSNFISSPSDRKRQKKTKKTKYRSQLLTTQQTVQSAVGVCYSHFIADK